MDYHRGLVDAHIRGSTLFDYEAYQAPCSCLHEEWHLL